jgi:hypothetical protein
VFLEPPKLPSNFQQLAIFGDLQQSNQMQDGLLIPENESWGRFAKYGIGFFFSPSFFGNLA